MDVFGGEVRRRDLFPLLALHLIAREPAYGNRLIEEIEAITDGVISVNPNTIYPLLRDLEDAGPDRGPVGASGSAHPPLLLDHAGGPQGVPAAGRRARAVPRLGDPVGDPDQARDLRVSAISDNESVRRRLARRGLGLLLRSRRLARVGRRVRACGGVGRLSGGWRLAALELDPGRPGRGHRARARARAPPPSSGRIPRPSSAGELHDHVRDRGERDRGSRRARVPAA